MGRAESVMRELTQVEFEMDGGKINVGVHHDVLDRYR